MRRIALGALACLAAFACSGCTLFLPHKPCLLYYGSMENVHGFHERGQGGVFERWSGVSYVFYPRLSLLQSSRSDLVLKISDEQPGYFAGPGLIILIQCPRPDSQLATWATADGQVRAWLVREDEYPGRVVKPQTIGDRSEWIPADYRSILAQSSGATEPLPKGVHRLVGTIEIQANNGPGVVGINLLVLHLTTEQPVVPDEAWLSRNESVTAQSLKEDKSAPVPQEDAKAWAELRKKRKLSPEAASVGGAFRVYQCPELF